MPARNLIRAFLGLYLVTGLVVFVESVLTVLAASAGTAHAGDRGHALVLGSFEAVSAALFLFPATMQWGTFGLLAVFATAFAHHALQGTPPWTLVVYAAVVLFVRVHGVDRDYFRHAVS